MFRDLQFGVRMLLKQPAFSLIAVLTLALGIGATSAVFSLIQGVLLTPPPYRQPQRLVLIPPSRTDGRQIADPRGWAAAQWMEWQKDAKSFEAIAAYDWSFNFLVLADGSESIEGMWVTRDYFHVVGLQPAMGRTFLESETGAKPASVIILGYDLWQRKFNGDPKIIGKTIRISRWDTPPTVIGVMPPGVRFLPSPANAQEPNYNVNALVDFWIPAPSKPAELKEPFWNVVGRLESGTTLHQAQAELTVIARRQAQADHDFDGITPRVQSLTAEMNRDGRRILLPLLGAAALVLLIACGNAAALLLVRGLQRQQEYAVRSALGVGRVGAFPASVHGEFAAGAFGRSVRRWPGVWSRQAVQADRRTCHPASGCRHDGLAGAGLRSRLGGFGRGSGRPVSRAARLPARPHARAQERRAEKQCGTWRTQALARA